MIRSRQFCVCLVDYNHVCTFKRVGIIRGPSA